VVRLQIGGDALGAQSALIDRKVITRFEPDHVVVFDEQVHTALHATVRAMRRHDLVDLAVRLPTLVRCVVQVRPEFVDDLLKVFDLAHFSSARVPINTRSA
jgi:hypothetical protein